MPEGYYEIAIGEPDIKRAGQRSDDTVDRRDALPRTDAAKILEEKYGVSAEVIDARSLVPFNYEKVIESVKKTGRIIAHGRRLRTRFALKEFAQTISELAFDYLERRRWWWARRTGYARA